MRADQGKYFQILHLATQPPVGRPAKGRIRRGISPEGRRPQRVADVIIQPFRQLPTLDVGWAASLFTSLHPPAPPTTSARPKWPPPERKPNLGSCPSGRSEPSGPIGEGCRQRDQRPGKGSNQQLDRRSLCGATIWHARADRKFGANKKGARLVPRGGGGRARVGRRKNGDSRANFVGPARPGPARTGRTGPEVDGARREGEGRAERVSGPGANSSAPPTLRLANEANKSAATIWPAGRLSAAGNPPSVAISHPLAASCRPGRD